MIINHNIPSLNSFNQYSKIDSKMKKSIEKLSSGLKINRAGDDPMGLYISEKMRSQLTGTKQAIKNTQDAIHFIQTAESWVAQTSDILLRLKELAIQSANGIYTQEDRAQVQEEVNQLISEIDRIAQVAEFNSVKLLSGDLGKSSKPLASQNLGTIQPQANAGVTEKTSIEAASANKTDSTKVDNLSVSSQDGVLIHIGANMDDQIRFHIENLSAFGLGLAAEKNPQGPTQSSLDYSTAQGANKAIGDIEVAMKSIAKQRSSLGAIQNRIQFSLSGLNTSYENIQAAESNIRDVNVAKEMTEFITQQILLQTSSSMLANANLRSQIVLKLMS